MNCNTAIQDFLLENILNYVKKGCQKFFYSLVCSLHCRLLYKYIMYPILFKKDQPVERLTFFLYHLFIFHLFRSDKSQE